MTEKLDCVVIGAGVVGLAAARALAIAGREVIVVEAESRVGLHTSSRNSEVIHAGLYYPEASLKARLCVAGRDQLYRYCKDHGVPHKRIGKLIVASDESDLEKLRAIDQQARRNNVTDLRFLDAATVRSLEPNVECVGGLLSPSTGIIESRALMTTLQGDLENHNGTVILQSRVDKISFAGELFEFRVDGESVRCRTLINAAGLGSVEVMKSMQIADGNERLPFDIPEQFYAKGHYFSYQGRSPFSHLIYPLPGGGGLGIHASTDLGQAVRFGPDVLWVNDIDYVFEDARKDAFVAAIKRYYPALDPNRLAPAYTGIRPKIVPYGRPDGDFLIHGTATHGIPNLVCLYGIESPGLTASLAIADYVADILAQS